MRVCIVCLSVRGAPRGVLLQRSVMLRVFFIVECGIARCLRYACIRISSIILTLGFNFVPNFVSFAASIAELTHGDKSRTVLNQ